MLYDITALESWIDTAFTVVGVIAVCLMPYSALGLFGKRVAYVIECILLLASAGIVITGVRKVGFPWESAIAFYAYFYFAIITILSIVLVVLARIARKEIWLTMQKSSPVN